jgi:hypothetical protein
MYTQTSLPPQGYPAPGTVVSIPLYVFWRHKGLISDRWHQGKPIVISNSGRAGYVCEEPWDVFAAGYPVQFDGYPSGLPSFEVLRRARALIGTRYQPLHWNCDHLVAVAHGQEPESPQVAATATVAVIAVGISLLTARR